MRIAGRGSSLDRMTRVYGLNLELEDGEYGFRATHGEGQLVAQDGQASSIEVDINRVEENVQVFAKRRRDGVSDRPVYKW